MQNTQTEKDFYTRPPVVLMPAAPIEYLKIEGMNSVVVILPQVLKST